MRKTNKNTIQIIHSKRRIKTYVSGLTAHTNFLALAISSLAGLTTGSLRSPPVFCCFFGLRLLSVEVFFLMEADGEDVCFPSDDIDIDKDDEVRC